jgi:hypothetical protein
VGLQRLLVELELAGVSRNRIGKAAADALEARGLARGLRGNLVSMLGTGARPLTLTRIAQLEASGMLSLDDMIAAGDDLPSRSDLAMVLCTLVLGIEALGIDQADPSIVIPMREALRLRPGAQQLVEQALAREAAIEAAMPPRRIDGPIVAGGAS